MGDSGVFSGVPPQSRNSPGSTAVEVSLIFSYKQRAGIRRVREGLGRVGRSTPSVLVKRAAEKARSSGVSPGDQRILEERAEALDRGGDHTPSSSSGGEKAAA